uniref:TetR/AcrR family transcriptional regulator n=1 Tax=Alistipes sp. TaxID=1872444 RepID=UPI0040561B9C
MAEIKGQREWIIGRAAKMFLRLGVKAVRMDDIAHELGISKRTLYELFNDKEELIFLAMKHLYEERMTKHKAICTKAENELAGMFFVMDEIFKQGEKHQRLSTNLKRFYPKIYEQLLKEGREANMIGLRTMIGRGIEKGYFLKEMNIEITIGIFNAVSQSIQKNEEHILPEGITPRQAFIQVLNTLFRGISTPEGIALIDRYTRDEVVRKYE